jgi:ribosomal protein S18 acetylase RimI-like enzyme
MHDTDRISLDPHFTKEQAASRYIGWIQDEVARGADLYKLIYKNQSIGYFTMKDLGNGVYYPFLAGIYQGHGNSGLGFNIAYQAMREIAARGGKSVSTYISTNNDRAIRLHVNMGFRFEEVTYVYIKHYDARG